MTGAIEQVIADLAQRRRALPDPDQQVMSPAEQRRVLNVASQFRSRLYGLSIAVSVLRRLGGQTDRLRTWRDVLVSVRSELAAKHAELGEPQPRETRAEEMRRAHLADAIAILDGRGLERLASGSVLLPGPLFTALAARGRNVDEPGLSIVISRVQDAIDRVAREMEPHEARIAEELNRHAREQATG